MDILIASVKELSEAYAHETLRGDKERASIFYQARQERLEALVVATRGSSGAKETDGGDSEG